MKRDVPPRLSNEELRTQYYRQINLSKKTALNFYETSTLVGYLLDLIYQSRKVEELRVRLVNQWDSYNVLDAFRLLTNQREISQVDLRDRLLRHKIKADQC